MRFLHGIIINNNRPMLPLTKWYDRVFAHEISFVFDYLIQQCYRCVGIERYSKIDPSWQIYKNILKKLMFYVQFTASLWQPYLSLSLIPDNKKRHIKVSNGKYARKKNRKHVLLNRFRVGVTFNQCALLPLISWRNGTFYIIVNSILLKHWRAVKGYICVLYIFTNWKRWKQTLICNSVSSDGWRCIFYIVLNVRFKTTSDYNSRRLNMFYVEQIDVTVWCSDNDEVCIFERCQNGALSDVANNRS